MNEILLTSIMKKGSDTERINFEDANFFTKSHGDFKLKNYSQAEILKFISNITLAKLRTRSEKKKLILNRILNDLAILLRTTI